MRLWPKHVILMRTRCSISMPKVISASSLSNTLPSGLTFHSFRTSKSRPNRAFNPDAPPAWLRLRVCVHHRGVARLAGAPVNFALGVMAPNERSTLVAGWIEHHTERIELDSDNVFHRVRGKNNFWAWEQLNDLCRNQPQLAWEIVLDIFRAPHHESVDWSLAAGPLEDLLAWHGVDIIEKIEAEARADRKFKELLHGVWRSTTPHAIWSRFEAARNINNDA